MQNYYLPHNLFIENNVEFEQNDPHLRTLNSLIYQYSPKWWESLNFTEGGIYILSGGRQVGKSTSCKLLIKHCLFKQLYSPQSIFYLPCDEIYTPNQLSQILRQFLTESPTERFLLIIDEVTYVPNWDRVIKALADEGHFLKGICILTGSDSIILKEASMRFPGRRGIASETDFHVYPLSFREFVDLTKAENQLQDAFQSYLISGGYLKAINELAKENKISTATYMIYEQWLRGDFIKHKKNEMTLQAVLQALLTIGVSQISYSALTQKIGLISKETCIDYCNLLERMDVLINLQAYDPNKQQGHPKKDRKFHFEDPFIYSVIHQWLSREANYAEKIKESTLIEAIVATHCKRKNKTFYFKGKGEIDVIYIDVQKPLAIEIKWAEQIRSNDLKQLKNFNKNLILTKNPTQNKIDDVPSMTVCDFLYQL